MEGDRDGDRDRDRAILTPPAYCLARDRNGDEEELKAEEQIFYSQLKHLFSLDNMLVTVDRLVER